jgi:hypothetical protein
VTLDRSTTRATLPTQPSALPADPIGDVGEVPLYANGTAPDLNSRVTMRSAGLVAELVLGREAACNGPRHLSYTEPSESIDANQSAIARPIS